MAAYATYKRQLRTSLKDKHRRVIRRYAELMGKSVSGLLEEIISQWVEQLPAGIRQVCDQERPETSERD